MNIAVLMVITSIMTLERDKCHELQQGMEVMFQDLDVGHVETLRVKPHGVDECLDLQRG